MKVTIKLFLPGATKPRFTGELDVDNINEQTGRWNQHEDIKFLFEVEQAINTLAKGRCHIEIDDVD